MEQVFNNLVRELKTDNKILISVIDAISFTKIIPAKSGNELIESYGSIENFFETNFQKGHRKISVTKYRKNGTGNSKIGNFQFDFSEKQPTPVETIVEQKPIQAMPIQTNSGMNGVVGLGFAELLNYGIKANESEVLKVENTFLKQQNEALKNQVDELKEERLQNKYNSENKKNQNDMLMGMAETFGPLLMNVLAKAPASTALNAPVVQPQFSSDLSEAKKQMISFVTNESTFDVHIEFLLSIIDKVNTEQGFYEKVLNLINPQSNE